MLSDRRAPRKFGLLRIGLRELQSAAARHVPGPRPHGPLTVLYATFLYPLHLLATLVSRGARRRRARGKGLVCSDATPEIGATSTPPGRDGNGWEPQQGGSQDREADLSRRLSAELEPSVEAALSDKGAWIADRDVAIPESRVQPQPDRWSPPQ